MKAIDRLPAGVHKLTPRNADQMRTRAAEWDRITTAIMLECGPYNRLSMIQQRLRKLRY